MATIRNKSISSLRMETASTRRASWSIPGALPTFFTSSPLWKWKSALPAPTRLCGPLMTWSSSDVQKSHFSERFISTEAMIWKMKRIIMTLLLAAFALSPVLPEAQAASKKGAAAIQIQSAQPKKHRKRHHRRHHRRRHHRRHHWPHRRIALGIRVRPYQYA